MAVITGQPSYHSLPVGWYVLHKTLVNLAQPCGCANAASLELQHACMRQVQLWYSHKSL